MGWYEEGRASAQIPTGWEAMGTYSSTGNSIWNKKTLFLLLGWPNTGTGSPERLWSLHLWRYPKAMRIWFWVECSSWCCLKKGGRGRLHDLQRSLPTSTVMCCCALISKLICTWTALSFIRKVNQFLDTLQVTGPSPRMRTSLFYSTHKVRM